MDNQPRLILKPTHAELKLGTSTMIFDPSPPRTPIPEMIGQLGIRRCPTMYLRHSVADTYHPISFKPYHLPGDPDSTEIPQIRWKSIGHHTEGFSGLPAARDFVLDHPNCMEIGKIFEWDGTLEDAPKVVFLTEDVYAQSVSGDYQYDES